MPLVLSVAAGALAVSATRQWSVTFDEGFHIVAGYSYWKTGDFRLLPDHPPLPGLLSALPLLPLDLKSPFAGQDWEHGDYWLLGQAFLAPPNDVDQIVLRARLPIVLLWLAGGWVVWAWSRRLFGGVGAAVSAALYFFYPDLMAHGSLATTDAAVTVFFAAALFVWVRFLERPTWGRCLLAAAAVAAVLLSKYSGLLILPVLVIATLCFWIARPATGRPDIAQPGPCRRGMVAPGALAFCALFSYAAIWACFGFRFRAALDPPGESYSHMWLKHDVRDPRDGLSAEDRRLLLDKYGRDDLTAIQQLLHDKPLWGAVLQWAYDRRVLPEAYVYCLASTLSGAQGRAGYLMGDVSLSGWWYYFPVAALLKTPAATLAVMVLAGAAAVRSRRATRVAGGHEATAAPSAFLRHSLVLIAVFEGIYWLASMRADLNIGHRHLLPAYPPLFVLCGVLGRWLHAPCRPGGTGFQPVLAGGCLAAAVLTNLLTWPHYLSYFTELVGGRSRGWRYLSDSNIDWGQGLKFLRRYLDEQPRGDVKLSYFGSADPAWYGLDVSYFEYTADLPFWQQPVGGRRLAEFTPGTFVYSITNLQGTYLAGEFRTWTAKLERMLREHEATLRGYLAGRPLSPGADPAALQDSLSRLYYLKLTSRLRDRPPDAVVGGSLFVYHLDEAALLKLLSD